jgi:hypothetical protein
MQDGNNGHKSVQAGFYMFIIASKTTAARLFPKHPVSTIRLMNAREMPAVLES